MSRVTRRITEQLGRAARGGLTESGARTSASVRGASTNYDPTMDRRRTALLIIDVQPEIVQRFGDSALTERLAQAAAAARGSGVRGSAEHAHA